MNFSERNLKCKQALEQLRTEIFLSHLENIKGSIIYDQPNNLIHQFKGILNLDKGLREDQESIFYISNQQILLRVYTKIK